MIEEKIGWGSGEGLRLNVVLVGIFYYILSGFLSRWERFVRIKLYFRLVFFVFNNDFL